MYGKYRREEIITYQASGFDRVVFELKGRGNWAGVGFSGDNQMVSNLILQNRLICRGGRTEVVYYVET